jgi:hypothetical protein
MCDAEESDTYCLGVVIETLSLDKMGCTECNILYSVAIIFSHKHNVTQSIITFGQHTFVHQ